MPLLNAFFGLTIGERRKKDGNGYHLLQYHCLAMAAVGAAWWEQSPVIRNSFCELTSIPVEPCSRHMRGDEPLGVMRAEKIKRRELCFFHKLPEACEDFQPEFLALFRVKLSCKDVVFPYH